MVGLRVTDSEHDALLRYANADHRPLAALTRLIVKQALARLEKAEREGRSPADAIADLTRHEA